jgi:hypothetical protein
MCGRRLGRVAAAAVGLPLAVAGGAGCTGPGRVAGDPLVGGGPPLAALTNPQRAAASSPTTAVPPLPPPNTTASNAALASAPGRPLDGRHDLRINETKPEVPASQAWAAPPPSGDAPPRVEIGQTSFDRGLSPAYPLASGSQASFESLRTRLQARAISWWRLETAEPGAFKFSCSVPSAQNRAVSRTYEATGASEAAAIQATLDQIDRER